jgi:hypothetical protein
MSGSSLPCHLADFDTDQRFPEHCSRHKPQRHGRTDGHLEIAILDGNGSLLEAVLRGCGNGGAFVTPDVKLSPDVRLRWLLWLLRLHRCRSFPGIRVKDCPGPDVRASRNG